MTEKNNFYKDIIDNLRDGVYFVDRERRITYWNKGAERITGFSSTQVVGRFCRDNILNHVSINGELLCGNHCPLAATIADGKPREAYVFLHHASGHRLPVIVRATPIQDENGKITGAVETFAVDESGDTLYLEMQKLRDTALTDALTGVGNRTYLDGRLHAAVVETNFLNRELIGILFIDLDNFKQINDQYGHIVGDRVLCMVVNTMQQSLRKSDILGRWGGDEFLVITREVDSLPYLRKIAEKLRMLVENSALEVAGTPLSTTISIGATLIQPGDTSESVLHRADSLLYQNKASGRNQVSLG